MRSTLAPRKMGEGGRRRRARRTQVRRRRKLILFFLCFAKLAEVVTTANLVGCDGGVVVDEEDPAAAVLSSVIRSRLLRLPSLFARAREGVVEAVGSNEFVQHSTGYSLLAATGVDIVSDIVNNNRSIANPRGEDGSLPHHAFGNTFGYGFADGTSQILGGVETVGAVTRDCIEPAQRRMEEAIQAAHAEFSGCSSPRPPRGFEAIEFELKLKTILACVLRYSSSVAAAADLEFAVEEAAAAVAFRNGIRERREEEEEEERGEEGQEVK